MKPIHFILAAFALLVAACSTGAGNTGKPTVATGIPPMADIAKRIAGDSVNVVTLLDANSDPETFEPTVGDMKKVYSADAYLSIGSLPFEQALVKKIQANKKDMKVRNAGEGVELLYGTHGDCPHHHSHEADLDDDEDDIEDGHDGHHHEGEADPHTWSSIANIRTIAQNVADALVELSPENEAYFRANLDKFMAELDSVDADYRSAIPQQAFLIWHPSLSYFARDYGLSQIAVGSENKELSVKTLQKQIDTAAAAGVHVIFLQKNFDSSQAENIAKQLGLTVVDFNPMAEDWLSELNKVKDALK